MNDINRCMVWLHPGTSPTGFRCIKKLHHQDRHDFGPAYAQHQVDHVIRTGLLDMLLTDAKLIINKARADLGPNLAGYSVRDLLLDSMPRPVGVIDRLIEELQKEGFV